MSITRALALAAALTAFASAPEARAADEPPHTVVRREGAIEIRDYAPMILAEVEVSGSMAGAGNAGFRPLAGYIFGANTSRQAAGSDEIAMTAPVIQTRSSRGTAGGKPRGRSTAARLDAIAATACSWSPATTVGISTPLVRARLVVWIYN